MENILVVYCTRTGNTRKIAKSIAKQLGAEVIRITDGRNYAGYTGFAIAAVKGLVCKHPKLKSYQTRQPLSAYDHIIVCAPIWSETVCPIAKTYLADISEHYQGRVSYVLTHMSKLSYEKQFSKMDTLAKKVHAYELTVSTKLDDVDAAIAEFVENFKK